MSTKASGIIDVHAHYATPQYVAELTEAGIIHPPVAQWTIERHLAEMDAAGVSRSMLSITTPGVTIGDVSNARRIARHCNDYGAELVARYPSRLGLFAALPLNDIEGSLLELRYALDVLNAQGICLFTNYDDRWLGDPAFDPIHEELQRRKTIVYVHPTSSDCCAHILPYIARALIEFGTDTTRAITNIIYLGAAHRFPDIRWIFSHAGGTMPYLIGRFDAHDSRGAEHDVAPDGFRAAARRFFYDIAQSANVATLTALNHVIPATNVLFGTDYPFQTMTEHVEYLRASGVYDDNEIDGIFSQNVIRALGELATPRHS